MSDFDHSGYRLASRTNEYFDNKVDYVCSRVWCDRDTRTCPIAHKEGLKVSCVKRNLEENVL